ncbi:prevent-host-death family protein [Cellulomonas sp. KH9]|jgi:antitoxin YefM|nr:prevent-host-death family protein [Cellulomonas sp. KH9]
MTMIRVMTTTSLANVKAHLSRFVDSVHDTHERVTITRNGEPAAVLMSPDDLASLEETIAVLSDAAVMAEVREADAAVARGDVTPLADVLRARAANA